MHQVLQITMKKQSFWSHVDQLMTCDNVPNVRNATIRNDISQILNNWWRPKTFEMQSMLQIAMNKQSLWSPVDQLMTCKNTRNAPHAANSNEQTIILITCWSTDDVWKRLQCWKCKDSQWKVKHLNQLITSENVRSAPNAANDNEETIILIICWSTDDMWQRSNCWKP